MGLLLPAYLNRITIGITRQFIGGIQTTKEQYKMSDTIKKIAPNPFTAKAGMEPRVFLGREDAVQQFEKSLDRAKQGYFNHFSILGEWGIGKTTLLKEYRKIAQSQGILTSFFPMREFTDKNLIDPVIQLVTQIPKNLPVRKVTFKKFKEYLSGSGITLPVIGGGINLPGKNKYNSDPQVLLLESLLTLWQDIKVEADIVFILVDDIQNLHTVPEYLTILKNVLSDEEIIKNTGFFFILTSTVAWWKQFMVKHHPVGRYFAPLARLKNLNREEVGKVIHGSLDGSGIVFHDQIIEKIYDYTEGHPFQMQVLCENLYDNQINGAVTQRGLEIALDKALQYLGELILDNFFDKASEKEKIILTEMAEDYTSYTAEDLAGRLEGMKNNEIRTMLLRLTEKGILRKVARGQYSINSRMLHELITRK